MIVLEIEIPGTIVPKERPRKGKGGRFYTPQRTRRFEAHARTCARLAIWKLREMRQPFAGPVAVELQIRQPDRRRRDADNQEKALWDALNGLAYVDDSQIVAKRVEVVVDRENPGATVKVWEVQR